MKSGAEAASGVRNSEVGNSVTGAKASDDEGGGEASKEKSDSPLKAGAGEGSEGAEKRSKRSPPVGAAGVAASGLLGTSRRSKNGSDISPYSKKKK